MDFSRFFRKKHPVLVRCTHCYDEFYLSPREVRAILAKNSNDTVCPIKDECHICHIGFTIPVKYIDKHGKQYLFHEIKPNIKNLDPHTVMQRIFGDHEHDLFFFLEP